MGDERAFQQHWLEIDPERMERYEAMFQWSPAAEAFYAPAGIAEGQRIADFGCGPGHAAIEFAKRVGPGGQVHALDINAEFVRRTRAKAEAHGLAGSLTAHLLTDSTLPLPDGGLDRVLARNAIIYVPDPVETLSEFRRVLAPGGIAHMVEGDWGLTAVAPVPTGELRTLVEAASWAFARPEIGRELPGHARRAGFRDVSVQVLTSPDTSGRLFGMIETIAGYAREGGALDPARIDAVLATVRRGLAEETYLAVSPQFIVTAAR